MLTFITIDSEKQSEQVIGFRKDSFKVSFGDTADFDEIEYLQQLKEKTTDYPDGFVVIEEEGKLIGYVNLYYLVPESRGKGRGKELHTYAKVFFKN